MTSTKELEKSEKHQEPPVSVSDHTKSQKYFERAQKILPGGVNSPVRSCKAVKSTPVFFHHADGCTLADVDGNLYTDFVGSWGAMILGHRYPRVQEALEQALVHGTSFGAPSPA